MKYVCNKIEMGKAKGLPRRRRKMECELLLLLTVSGAQRGKQEKKGLVFFLTSYHLKIAKRVWAGPITLSSLVPGPFALRACMELVPFELFAASEMLFFFFNMLQKLVFVISFYFYKATTFLDVTLVRIITVRCDN